MADRWENLRLTPHVLAMPRAVYLLQTVEAWVFQCLLSRDPLLWVVRQQFVHKIDKLRTGFGDEPLNTRTLLSWEVKLHVCGVLFELIQELFGWGSNDIMDSADLVDLVFAWEQCELAHQFEDDAADAPDVHLAVVVAVGQDALGSAVPAGRYVLRIW